MSTARRDRFEMLLTDLTGNLFEFANGEAMELVGMGQFT